MPDETLRGEQGLALRVLEKALTDTRSKTQGQRDSARRFFASGDWLAFWCAVARVSTAAVLRAAQAAPGHAIYRPRSHHKRRAVG